MCMVNRVRRLCKESKKERKSREREKNTSLLYCISSNGTTIWENRKQAMIIVEQKKRFSLFNQTSYRHSCEYTCIYYAAFFLSCSASTLYCRSSNCCSYPYRILSLATIDSLEWWLHSIAQLYVERERKLPWNVTVETKRRKRKSWHCE